MIYDIFNVKKIMKYHPNPQLKDYIGTSNPSNYYLQNTGRKREQRRPQSDFRPNFTDKGPDTKVTFRERASSVTTFRVKS